MSRPIASALVLGACLAVAVAVGAGDVGRAGPASSGVPPAPADRAPAPDFDSLFSLDARFVLDEPDSALVTEVTDLDVDADGRLAVPSPSEGQVRIYAPDGRLLDVVGGRGDGPGEFQRPVGVAFDRRAGLWVTDAESPRITRFSPSLELDTVFPVRGAYFASSVESHGDRIAVFAMRTGEGPGGDRRLFDVYTSDGERVGSFHPLRTVIRDTPGWIAAARSRLAAGATGVFTADNLLYPIFRWTWSGEPADSVATPPDSWRQASKPEPGRFRTSEPRKAFERWRRTFTTISGLELHRDSLLLVAHQDLDPRVLEYESADYRVDLYRVGDDGIEKLHEDVRLPGRLLHAGRHVHLLLANPAQGSGWTLGRYALRADAEGPEAAR